MSRANDSASSCVILLNLIEKIKWTNLNIDCVFFDKTEHGLIGSKEYVDIVGKENIECMINLDMCGMGDNIMIYSNDFNSNTFNRYPFKSLLDDAFNLLTSFADRDHTSFIQNDIPTLLVMNSADRDLKWFKDYSYGKISKPNDADFLKTMYKDSGTIDRINERGMKMIFNYLSNHIRYS